MTMAQLRDRLSMSEDAAARPDYSDLIELLDSEELTDELRELIEDGEFLGLLAH